MINRLIQESEQRLFESLSLDDKIFYEQVITCLHELEFHRKDDEPIDHSYCFSEEDYADLNEEKDELHDEIVKLERKLDKIRRILNE